MQSIARRADILRPGMHVCPAHDDKSPSLSVRRGENGDWLLHCFAGCRTIDVLEAAGLRWADVFADPRSGNTRPRRSDSLLDARREVLDTARRQAWARDPVQTRY